MTETKQQIGRRITFCELMERFDAVEIPIIQRDYVQGRKGQEEVRAEFLAALADALTRDGESGCALDLDFVYGSSTAGSNGFAPLDGQQRLTTLFLLHWYLAWRDGQLDDFLARFVGDQRSAFSYRVRPSSQDFFDRLATSIPDVGPDGVDSMRRLIVDQVWFFRSWQRDPTIDSALTVLEEIHDQFGGEAGLYARLTNTESPRITFHLLEMENFGLSDELYIKMNARGKPLTRFETFKARLEPKLAELFPVETREIGDGEVSVMEYFSRRMDTVWSDVLWKHRDQATNLFDDVAMRVFHSVALIAMDPGSDVALRVSNLRRMPPDSSFLQYVEHGCITRRVLETFILAMDCWASWQQGQHAEDSQYGATAALDDASRVEPSYPELVRFAAYCVFLRKCEPGDSCLGPWMRVVHNLVTNSDIERPADFASALEALDELGGQIHRILEHLACGDKVSFFNRQQVREERIKAALLLRGGEWTERIVAAERHPYFDGQIEFLLEFSGILEYWLTHSEQIEWGDAEDDAFLASFTSYFRKAKAVFGPRGLNAFPAYQWERALLAAGDYTLMDGRNHSLLYNRSGRSLTWKQLLRGDLTSQPLKAKRDLVRIVLDAIDPEGDVSESLQQFIDSAEIDIPWRRKLVEMPDAIGYCAQRMIRFRPDGSVFLISKIRTSSEHRELHTLHLYHTVLEKMARDGDLAPLTPQYFSAIGEDYCPGAVLRWPDQDAIFDIDYSNGKYELRSREENSAGTTVLEGVGEQSSSKARLVPENDIEAALIMLVQAARAFKAASQPNQARAERDP